MKCRLYFRMMDSGWISS